MNSQELEFFVRVARLGSISRAAIEVGMEQSTMTRHIAGLERKIGTRLFHRSGRGVELTQAGLMLLQEAQSVIDALARTRHVASQLGSNGPARLVVAAQPTLAQRGLPAIAKAMQAQFPHTQLSVREALGNQVIRWLATGEVDLALLYVPSEPGLVDVDVLMHEPLYFVSPPTSMRSASSNQHGIGSEPEISQQEVLRHPLILPSTAHGLRTIAEDMAQRWHMPLRVVAESDGSTAVTRQLVRAGIGSTLLPLAAVADEVARGELRAQRIVQTQIVRDIALATARNRPPLIAQWEILQIVRQSLSVSVGQGLWPGVSAMADAASKAAAALPPGPKA